MLRATRRQAILGILLLLLAISIAGNIILYRQASRSLFAEEDLPLIERTIAMFAASGSTNPADIRAQAFPIVLHQGDRTCVELRRYDGLGHQGACYDRSDRLIGQIESVTD